MPEPRSGVLVRGTHAEGRAGEEYTGRLRGADKQPSNDRVDGGSVSRGREQHCEHDAEEAARFVQEESG